MAEASDHVPTLLVIGAGPKGLAIAAKQVVLRQLGMDAPDVVLLDRRGVATHWSGAHGYTDGRRLLGTAPEKDIGFPYDSTAWGNAERNRAVDRAMLAYSWQSYLVDTYRYAAWIDRDRARPTHREWAAYLGWIGERTQAQVVLGEVDGLGIAAGGRRWCVRYRTPETTHERSIMADGVVLTGPGAPIRVPGQPEQHPRIFDGATVWQALDALAPLRLTASAPLRIGIVGTGETAAATIVALLDTLGEAALIDILSPRGVLYSRDEGFEENRLFSDPDPHDPDDTEHQHPLRWLSLTEEDRREFVRRADRGVFSVQAVREMTRAWNVRSVTGTATSLEAQDDTVLVTATYGDVAQTYRYDYVVVARGFDALTFLTWLDDGAREALIAAAGALTATALERAVGYDLAFSGLTPRLHVPMLAGVAQGPGFPNLSCLGLLAERALAPYTPLPT